MKTLAIKGTFAEALFKVVKRIRNKIKMDIGLHNYKIISMPTVLAQLYLFVFMSSIYIKK